jgi:very-short-patch-repair endonuclease
MIDRTPLHELMRRQYGLVSNEQARAQGFSPGQISRRVRSGEWVRVAPRVYRAAGSPSGPLVRLLAATMSTHGVASHRSAATLWSLIEDHPRRPEITLARGRSAISLEEALNRGIARRQFTVGRLAARLDVGPGHHLALRQIFEVYRDGGAPNTSVLETLIFRALRAAGLPLPVRQYPITLASARYVLDFAYPAQRIFLEGDGFGAHLARRTFHNDRVRQNLLILAGWLPLRFAWGVARFDPDQLADTVRAGLVLRA